MTPTASPSSFRSRERFHFWKALCVLTASRDVNQAELAAQADVTQGYVSKFLRGKQTPAEPVRRRLAAFFGLSYQEMLDLGEQEAAKEAFPEFPDPAEDVSGNEAARLARYAAVDQSLIKDALKDIKAREIHGLYYTEVPLREATGSMGGGSTETGVVTLTYLSFRTEWIRAKGNPKSMSVIRAFGDSMFPTIIDGSVVLIDESRNQFVNNKVFYVRHNGQMYVKRLVERGGAIYAASDNAGTPLAAADADDFAIIGRCIWVGRELE